MEAVAPVGQLNKVMTSTPRTVPERGERQDPPVGRVLTSPGAQDGQASVGFERLRELLQQQSQATETKVVFRVDEDSGKLVAEIRDYATGDLVRQIPPEEMIRISKAISEYLGMLIDERH